MDLDRKKGCRAIGRNAPRFCYLCRNGKTITMKRTILTLTALLMSIFVIEAQKGGKEVDGGPKISFDKEVHDYGTIQQGADGTCSFTIKNEGDEPLVINNCKGSCGCTVPKCPKKPIAPGETGQIKVRYDTKRIGPINKSVRVSSNATNSPNKTIRIKGKVVKKKTTPKKETSEDAPVDK